MEHLVVTTIEVLFIGACAVVVTALAVTLFQEGFDAVQRRAYNNQKKWDNEDRN